MAAAKTVADTPLKPKDAAAPVNGVMLEVLPQLAPDEYGAGAPAAEVTTEL